MIPVRNRLGFTLVGPPLVIVADSIEAVNSAASHLLVGSDFQEGIPRGDVGQAVGPLRPQSGVADNRVDPNR